MRVRVCKAIIVCMHLSMWAEFYLPDIGSASSNEETMVLRFTLDLQSVFQLSLGGEEGGGRRGEEGRERGRRVGGRGVTGL